MRHDPAIGAIVIMLRSLKMQGMAQAVTDLIDRTVVTPLIRVTMPRGHLLLKRLCQSCPNC